jgi:hypothetical protein
MAVTRILASLTALTILAAGDVAAQERGQIGVTMGYPAALGVIWHVAERLAIRPEVSFAFSSGEVTTALSSPLPGGSVVVTTSDTSVVSPGLSALYYLHNLDQLKTYLSPRFVYSRTRTDTQVSEGLFGGSDLTGSTYTYSGSFGAHFSPHHRFAVFGEIGVAFLDTHNTSTISVTDSHQIVSRGGVGIVFYLR